MGIFPASGTDSTGMFKLSGIPFIGGMFPNPDAEMMKQGLQNAAGAYAGAMPQFNQAYQNLLGNVLGLYSPAQNALQQIYGGGGGMHFLGQGSGAGGGPPDGTTSPNMGANNGAGNIDTARNMPAPAPPPDPFGLQLPPGARLTGLSGGGGFGAGLNGLTGAVGGVLGGLTGGLGMGHGAAGGLLGALPGLGGGGLPGLGGGGGGGLLGGLPFMGGGGGGGGLPFLGGGGGGGGGLLGGLLGGLF